MPVLGVIFLRHATNRYRMVLDQIKAEQAAGTMLDLPLAKADFLRRRALMLPKPARYDELLRLPAGTDLGKSIIKAMEAWVVSMTFVRYRESEDQWLAAKL